MVDMKDQSDKQILKFHFRRKYGFKCVLLLLLILLTNVFINIHWYGETISVLKFMVNL